MVLAVGLHAAIGLALWWLWQNPPRPPTEEVIEITLEPAKPPEPPPPAQPSPAIPLVEGLRPPAPIVSDRPTQVPPKGDPIRDTSLAPPPPLLLDTPQAREPPPADPPPSTAAREPASQPAPAAPEHHALATPAPAPPPPPQLRQPEHRPSPLTLAPHRQPPAGTPSDSPTHSPFVNPADTYNRARATDNYLWQVARKLQGYTYQARVNATEGLTVVRIVIARDGRLLHVEVVRSSGFAEFDKGVIAGVRAGSPYTPLPPDIRGDSATFDLPLVSTYRR